MSRPYDTIPRREFRGRKLPVPWITLWSHERDLLGNAPLNFQGDRLAPAGDAHLFYRERKYGVRSRAGGPFSTARILTLHEVESRKGEPLWSQINSRRQHEAMLNGRCQVCGKHLLDGRPKPVLFVTTGMIEGTVQDAPCCPKCARVALASCPALGREEDTREAFLATSWEPAGIYGRPMLEDGSGWGELGHYDLYELATTTIEAPGGRSVKADGMFVAKQLLVRLIDPTPVNLEEVARGLVNAR